MGLKRIGMARLSHNVASLLSSGKRWFAKPPEGFESPSQGAIESMAIYANLLQDTPIGRKVVNSINKENEPHYSAQLAYICSSQKWIRENGPTLFVSKEILDACERTDAFGGVEGSDIKTVYPTGYISLPKGRGFVSKQTGDRLAHIWFTILDSEQELTVVINGENEKLLCSGKKLFIHGYWDKSRECSSFTIPLNVPGRKLGEILEELRGKITLDNHVVLRTSADALREESYDLGFWMGALTINLFLLMQSYPKYMDKMPKEKSERQGFKNKPSPESIIIRPSKSQPIIRSSSDNDRSSVVESTGITVGEHWRRGHWRRQPHGEFWELKNPEAKIIVLDDNRHAHMKWIMPIYVGLLAGNEDGKFETV